MAIKPYTQDEQDRLYEHVHHEHEVTANCADCGALQIIFDTVECEDCKAILCQECKLTHQCGE